MRTTTRRLAAVGGLVIGLVAIGRASQAPQQPTFKGGTQTVAVYATVTSADGRLVTDLSRDAFTVLDKGKPQAVTVFATERQPISVVVLLDRSGSMLANFGLVEKAAESFVTALLPTDQARIGSFSNGVEIDPEDFTSDHDELLAILRTSLLPEGPTPLWNAVNVGIAALRRQQGRRVILVFTDGVDTPGNGRSDNSSLGDVMKRAEEDDVMVYAIGLAGQNGPGGIVPGGGRRGGPGAGSPPPAPVRRMEKPDSGLPKIAAATGGGYFELTSTDDLGATFSRVADELHHQYALGFTPAVLDGSLHPLEVRVAGAGLTARARKSYLAADTPPPPPLPARIVPLSAIQSAFGLIEPSQDTPGIRTWVGLSRGEGGKTAVAFVWEPASQLRADGRLVVEAPAQVSLAATGSSNVSYFDDVVPKAVTSTYGGVASSRATFEADPGPLQLRLSLQNAASRVIGSATRTITVPNLAASVSLGTPEVLRARTLPELQTLKADPAAVPVATREFSRSERLLVRVPVYGPGPGVPGVVVPLALRVRLLNRAGQVISTLPAGSSPVAGVQQIDVPVASLPPADYLVHIEVDAPADEHPPGALVGFRLR